MAALTLKKSGEELSQYVIRKKLVSIGRSAQCDLVLNSKDVSALHANIINYQNRFRLIDLDSTNGTFVNGKKITEHFLGDKDEISISNFRIIFSAVEELEKTTVVRSDKDYIEQSHKLVEELKKTHLGTVIDEKGKARAGRALEKTLGSLDESLSAAKIAHNQLKILFNLSETLNSAKGYETILKIILNSALETTGMERGAVVLYNEEEKLETVVSVSMEKEKKSIISYSIVDKAIKSDEVIISADAGSLKDLDGAKSIIAQKIKATICMPLKSRNKKILGALYLDSRLAGLKRENVQPEFLRMFSIFAATAIQTSQSVQREKQMNEELITAKEREKYNKQLQNLEEENKRLVKRAEKVKVENILGMSAPMEKLFESIGKVAPTDVTVLITGETGTGKGLIAKSIHDLSQRKKREFVTIDCASIPSELLESELFGYERGAFTGAVSQKKGRIEAAECGTLFLDEIGDMSLNLQAKLLRFLQEKSFERVGGTKTIILDARVVAATNKDLKAAVGARLFREDLYYRLCGVTLHAPPLRERGEDVVIMANAFLDEVRTQNNLALKGFTPEAKNTILHYSWEGNVRQLKNVIQRGAILCNGEFIDVKDMGLESASGYEAMTLKDAREEVDKKLIKQQLLAHKGNLSKTARVLDVDRSTLRELMKKYEIQGFKGE